MPHPQLDCGGAESDLEVSCSKYFVLLPNPLRVAHKLHLGFAFGSFHLGAGTYHTVPPSPATILPIKVGSYDHFQHKQKPQTACMHVTSKASSSFCNRNMFNDNWLAISRYQVTDVYHHAQVNTANLAIIPHLTYPVITSGNADVSFPVQ